MKTTKTKPKAEKKPLGRPSEYDQAKAAEICSRLALGESLNRICKDDHMPDMSTVYRWMFANEDFRNNYARAREDQAETHADELIDLADVEPVVIDENGKLKIDSAWVNLQRLRIDTRKWVASKLKPKRFGDKLDVQHAGGISVVVATGIQDDQETH